MLARGCLLNSWTGLLLTADTELVVLRTCRVPRARNRHSSSLSLERREAVGGLHWWATSGGLTRHKQ